jgi:hypothetical protein
MIATGPEGDGQFEARADSARRPDGYGIEPLRDPLGKSCINRVALALIESIEWLSGIMHTKVCLQVDGTLPAIDF